ncbi:MAG: hypothetical protein ACO1NW_03745 [Chitinophagaceae bacterium]
MKLTSGLICMLALFFLLACNNGGEKANPQLQGLTAERVNELLLLEKIFSSYTSDSIAPVGDSVSRGVLDRCTDVYDSVMRTRGFDKIENLPINLKIDSTLRISSHVAFSNKVFMNWLIRRVQNYETRNQGRNKDRISVNMVFGMYDRTYVQSHNLGDSMAYRITVFIVPSVGKYSKTSILEDSHPAYNLGGVAP